MALIVEVKTGGYRRTPNKIETRDGLQRSISRLGICTPNTVERTSGELMGAKVAQTDAAKIGKLLIMAQDPPDRYNAWNQLPLRDALDFIRDRVNRYPTEQGRDRLRFGDPLMQYLAWDAAGRDR